MKQKVYTQFPTDRFKLMEVAKSLGLGKENIFHYVKKFNTGAGKQNYVNLQKLV